MPVLNWDSPLLLASLHSRCGLPAFLQFEATTPRIAGKRYPPVVVQSRQLSTFYPSCTLPIVHNFLVSYQYIRVPALLHIGSVHLLLSFPL